MPRVLIPSDNCDFVHSLAAAYRRVGWEVVVGVGNFDLRAAAYDVVHLQWPEELSGWRPPGELQFQRIVETLEYWQSQAKVVMTVHNLTPHRNAHHPDYRRLYEAFYERVHIFAHFTEASRELALERYPASKSQRHVVTGFFNADHLLPAERDRAAAKLRNDEFVFLVIGGLREWDEVQLVQQAYDAAAVPGKRLLMAARYDEDCGPWRLRWRRWTLARWLRARGAVVRQGYIPDADMHQVVDAADAIIIPRFRSLNSGLPALGATFGKAIIAPRCGAYPELLAGTKNPIYTPGDAADLARAMEEAALLDRSAVAAENRRLSDRWQWDAMVQRIVAEL